LPRFDAVLESIGVRYTMFAADGKPLRAVVNLRFREAKAVSVEKMSRPGRRG
jgi:hypothetical protein